MPESLFSLLQSRQGPPDMKRKDADAWPEMEAAWAGRQIEMPEEAKAVRKLRPMSWMDRLVVPPGALAATYPWNTIIYDKDAIQRDKMPLDDLLVHELTHVGQGQKEGLIGMLMKIISADPEYMNRDYEQEAFKAEGARKVRRGDIALPGK